MTRKVLTIDEIDQIYAERIQSQLKSFEPDRDTQSAALIDRPLQAQAQSQQALGMQANTYKEFQDFCFTPLENGALSTPSEVSTNHHSTSMSISWDINTNDAPL